MVGYRAIFLLTWIVGCQTSTHDSAGDDPFVDPVDGDEDGFSVDADCDDADASVFPSAEELCNGLDDNCNGRVDEDVQAEMFQDVDGDGFGDPTVSQMGCEVSAGWVDNDLDCDDTDPVLHDQTQWYEDLDLDGFGGAEDRQGCVGAMSAVLNNDDCDDDDPEIFPGQVEQCDTWDNDCDGEVDEADAEQAREFYEDADGDDHGDPGVVEVACWQPDGFVQVPTDCDDVDELINPDATDVCGDGLDQDCSGRADNGCTTLDTSYAGWQVNGAADGGSFGGATAAGDVTGDGQVDILSADFAWGAEDSNQGAVHVVPILSEGTYDVDDVETARVTGPEGEQMGTGLSVDDIDSDGVDDIFASPSSQFDTVYGFLGPVSGDLTFEDADVSWSSDGLAMWSSVKSAGDLNGDGNDDVAVGLPFSGGTIGAYPGAVHLFFDVPTGALDATDADATITYSAVTNGFVGIATEALGDTNGDGFDDLAVTAFGTGGLAGEAWVFHGPITADQTEADADAVMRGSQPQDFFGFDMKGAGDVNSDGYEDLWISSYGGSLGGDYYTGAAYLFHGPFDSEREAWDADALIGGSQSYAYFNRLEAGHDVDGDGHTDLMVGALGEGAAYFFYGPRRGYWEAGSADLVLQSEMGIGLSGAVFVDDMDSDGMSEILLGSPNAAESGAVFAFSSSLLP